MLLMPHLSPRRHFFSITVPPGFRETEPGQKALRRFHWSVISATVAAVVFTGMFAQPNWSTLLAVVPMLPVIGGAAAFLRERAFVRRNAGRPADVAPTVPAPLHAGHLPAWTILAAFPFALPLATAVYLRAHWDEIPARFPVHWGLDGAPNGWATKTVHGVYGPLLLGAGLSLLVLMLALAVFYGSRRGAMRNPTLAIMIGVLYLLNLAFSSAGLLPLLHLPAWVFVIPFLVFVAGALLWSFKVTAEAAGEDTPDECWSLGGIYYNPRDPAVFVEKRIGIGYTVNFGNRLSWILLGIFAAGVLGLIFAVTR